MFCNLKIKTYKVVPSITLAREHAGAKTCLAVTPSDSQHQVKLSVIGPFLGLKTNILQSFARVVYVCTLELEHVQISIWN